MDREQDELQFLGLFGICSESIKIIYRWRSIMLRITVTLILPLAFVFLAHLGISMLFTGKVIQNEDALILTSQGILYYIRYYDVSINERTTYKLIKVVYFILFIVLSLLSTSAVAYTIACVYSGKEVTYQKVMSFVPKVWKRVMVTLICNFGILMVYHFVALFLFMLSLSFFGEDFAAGILIMFISSILYVLGLVYVTLIWQLASVVSVLEESYGFQATTRSKTLMKGKMGISLVLYFLVNFCLVAAQFVFQQYVVIDHSIGLTKKIGFGALSLGLISVLFLFGLVLQTVIYFVCKSYHHENIDKSSLLDRLENVYIGEYPPLNKDVEMEQV